METYPKEKYSTLTNNYSTSTQRINLSTQRKIFDVENISSWRGKYSSFIGKH